MTGLSGQTVLVTGATGGIGRETARALSKIGAHVILGARDAVRGQAFADELQSSGGRADVLPIDLASFTSIREAARRFAQSHPSLDVLVNNAGTVLRKRRLTPDGHEETWQTNFLGGFLLTSLLMPALRAVETVGTAGTAGPPRVVNVSSEAHRSGRIDFANLELATGYRPFRAYANSKLAQILFTRELARREPTVTANALHPGTISTGIWRPAPAWMRFLVRVLLPSAEKGARPVVRLASAADVSGVSGRYFDRFREAQPSVAARSDADAARLWEIAEQATA